MQTDSNLLNLCSGESSSQCGRSSEADRKQDVARFSLKGNDETNDLLPTKPKRSKRSDKAKRATKKEPKRNKITKWFNCLKVIYLKFSLVSCRQNTDNPFMIFHDADHLRSFKKWIQF